MPFQILMLSFGNFKKTAHMPIVNIGHCIGDYSTSKPMRSFAVGVVSSRDLELGKTGLVQGDSVLRDVGPS